MGQDLYGRVLRAPVVHGDPDGQVLGRRLRVLHEHIEVAVVVEDPRVKQLELRTMAVAAPVLVDEALVGVLPLRVLVEPLHVGVRGRGVEVEVVLLHVLAVVALRGHEAEEALLEDGVALVPQREAEAEDLVAVADGGQAVLAPAVGAAARLVVGEVALAL